MNWDRFFLDANVTDWIQATAALGAAIGLVQTLKLQSKANLLQQLNIDRQFLPDIIYNAVGGSIEYDGIRMVQVEIEAINNPIFNFRIGAQSELSQNKQPNDKHWKIIEPSSPILVKLYVPKDDLSGKATFQDFAGGDYTQEWKIVQQYNPSNDGGIINYVNVSPPIHNKWKKLFKS
ncbi:hypothetical protein GZH53_17385 [Flavihumibacter sp. R14]|nr:hypothetical protein [Flavihumibacter soli]